MTVNDPLKKHSLVLYKNEPAVVTELNNKKISIQTPAGSLSVRPKDVTLLHAGPLASLAALTPPKGDIATAWELLAGDSTTLPELAELAYSAFTPQSAWAVWQQVLDGLYFSGEPDAIDVHTAVAVAETKAARAAKAEEDAAWDAFVARAAAGQMADADGRYLQDVVAVALGQHSQSKALKALGQGETPENAHALLLKLGYWTEQNNPYPARLGVATKSADVPLPPLPEEPRRDLTHLPAFAIDDEGSSDPDDALSWDNGRLWVHIADVAAIIPPNSPADDEARGRGANLYLPEGTVTMLPEAATAVLALGLQDVSPALSFGLRLDDDGQVQDVEITPSWVKVTRLTYAEADARLDEAPFRDMLAWADRYAERRRQNGAVEIDLPEIRIKVVDGVVAIRPLPHLRSRDLVRDAMLMAGEAAARFAFNNAIPVPYTVQDPPSGELPPATSLSNMFARRKLMSPSQQSSQPGAHAGLGMGLYAQATSPLRRYLDLVVHQQLRAFLRGQPLLDDQAVMARVGAADAISREVRYAERQSIRHWLMVYLQQQPQWQGDGAIVDRRGKRDIVLIPALALDVAVHGKGERPLDTAVTVVCRSVNLTALAASFRYV